MAQSISITGPANSQTISGTAFTFTSAVSGITNLCSVEYDVNGEIAGVTRQTPWSYVWNTNYVFNNQYNTVVATARDCLNNVLATSAAVSFTVDNAFPEHASVLNWTIAASCTSNCSGNLTVTATFTGTNATNCTNSSGCTMAGFVDGKPLLSVNTNANPYLWTINTAAWDDASVTPTHNVVAVLYDNTIASLSPFPGNKGVAQWEKQISFNNSGATMELRANRKNIQLCTTASPNCPTSFALTGLLAKTDNTTSGATLTGCGATQISPAAAVSTSFSSGTCTVSEVAVGSATVTLTESGGKTATVWVDVDSSNPGVGHFKSDGTITNAYTLGTPRSLRYCSYFTSSDMLGSDGSGGYWYPAAFKAGQDLVNSGCTVVEQGISGSPASGQSQTSFTTQVQNAVTSANAKLASYPLYPHAIGDSLIRGTNENYLTTTGTGNTYSPLASNIWMSGIAASSIPFVGADMVDEVNFIWGALPLGGNITWGNPLLGSSITISSGTGTIPMTSDAIQSGNRNFIILGATTNSCINSNASNGSVYHVATTGSSFTFTQTGLGTSNCGNITITSASDPGLVIEPFVAWWTNPDGSACTSSCTTYITHNAFTSFMNGVNAVPNRMKITWPNGAATNCTALENWEGNAGMADYATFYHDTETQSDYLPQYKTLFQLLDPGSSTNHGMQWQFHNKLACLDATARLRPIIVLAPSSADGVNYGHQGYSVAVSTVGNGLFTFAAPHRISNIKPLSTRMWYPASSPTNYYIISAPTSTTVNAIYALPPNCNPACKNSTNTTLTFDDGTMTTITGANHLVLDGTGIWNSQINGGYTCAKILAEEGHTATISGSGNATLDGATIWITNIPVSQPGDTPCTATYWFIGQIPSGSASGSTATIVADNGYVRGVNFPGSASELGPRFPFTQTTYANILRAGGSRQYDALHGPLAYPDDPSAHDQTGDFQDTGNNYQTGAHPRFLRYGNAPTWNSIAMAQKISARLAKFTFGQLLPGPDLGPNIDCAERTNVNGSILMCQSALDGPITRTIPLSDINASGQQIMQIDSAWNQINETALAVNTSSITVTFLPGEFLAIVAPNNFAAEFPQETFAVHQPITEDVPNASKVALQYAYTEYPFEYPQIGSQMLFETYDCGGGGASIPPVDRQIGPIYYRMLYLKADGSVLATSDVEIL